MKDISQQSKKVVIIAGAGASHDFSREKVGAVWLPPLAKDLFAPNRQGLITQYRPLRVSVSNIRDAIDQKVPIEEYLEKMWAKASIALVGQQIHAIIFYLQHLLWECSRHCRHWDGGNYGGLINQLLQADLDLGIITFDYDTLVEDALVDLYGGKVKFENIDSMP